MSLLQYDFRPTNKSYEKLVKLINNQKKKYIKKNLIK